MALLCRARFLIAAVPFRRWRRSLGSSGAACAAAPPRGREADLAKARQLASQVDRAAWRLPFECKCLPRAMALSWLLQRKGVPHDVVIAIRPADARDSAESLHAWLEVAGATVIGDLPGPWHELYRA